MLVSEAKRDLNRTVALAVRFKVSRTAMALAFQDLIEWFNRRCLLDTRGA
jgi:hypothetical protein